MKDTVAANGCFDWQGSSPVVVHQEFPPGHGSALNLHSISHECQIIPQVAAHQQANKPLLDGLVSVPGEEEEGRGEGRGEEEGEIIVDTTGPRKCVLIREVSFTCQHWQAYQPKSPISDQMLMYFFIYHVRY